MENHFSHFNKFLLLCKHVAIDPIIFYHPWYEQITDPYPKLQHFNFYFNTQTQFVTFQNLFYAINLSQNTVKKGQLIHTVHRQLIVIIIQNIFSFFVIVDFFYYIREIPEENQSRLSEVAADVVKELLPEYAENDLASLCSWADHVKFRYRWSSVLHYINTPDLCNYKYNRDCKDEDGRRGRCVSGAIKNYTTQLLTYNSDSSQAEYNLTEALLFLSHFMGDIHQPLHVGFKSDKGGNAIDVRWYRRKQNLHHVWDDNIIETAEERFYNSNVDDLIDAIQEEITTDWGAQVKKWERCSLNKTTCPDVYASEGIKAACDWAYKDVTEGSVLEDEYFESRLPVVKLRLAQAGVRLAATLNRIFSGEKVFATTSALQNYRSVDEASNIESQ